MKSNLRQFIDEAIALELTVSDLYLHFSDRYKEDYEFWWTLALEEKNHAALLKSLKLAIPYLGNLPHELVAMKTEELKGSCAKINEIITNLGKEGSRKKAFEIALELEESAGEVHYQAFIENDALSEGYKIFQKLNNDDKDHADRIRNYMENHIL